VAATVDRSRCPSVVAAHTAAAVRSRSPVTDARITDAVFAHRASAAREEGERRYENASDLR
jgi:hypothetical protein